MDTFDDEQKEDLEERGFTNQQIEFLESFDTNKEGLYADVSHMNDNQMTPEEIMDFYNTEPDDEEQRPSQGGKNKKGRKSRKGKKSRKDRKSRKGRKSKSKK